MNRNLLSFLFFAMLTMNSVATPVVNCENFCCPRGYRYLTGVEPRNVACLAGVCTNSTCCYPPTCASSVGYWGSCATAGLKQNAEFIQCPQGGCSQTLCCRA